MAAPSEKESKADLSNERTEKIRKRLEVLRNEYQKCKEQSQVDPFLVRCQKYWAKLDNLPIPKEGQNETELKEWLKLYAQLILDLSFYEENQLVEEDFPETDAIQQLHSVLDCLTDAENVVRDWFSSDVKMSEVVGVDIAECLLWRRGGLMYMYCCTLAENVNRVNQHKQHFLKCAHDGVQYLCDMLRVRAPLQSARADIITNNDEIFQLLVSGLYSDTHVLALMYGGELCGWFLEHSSAAEREQYGSFSAEQCGMTMLQTFLDATQGPLKSKGWSTERAEQLMEQFKDSV